MRSIRSLVRLTAATALVGGLFLSAHVATASPSPSPLNCGDRGTVVGDAGNNVLQGNSADNVICGYGGNDKMKGRGGNDDLRAGMGDDALRGQSGDDFLSGDQGNDRIFGGPGSDQLNGGPGKDVLNSLDYVGGNDDVNGGYQGEGDLCLIDAGDSAHNCDATEIPPRPRGFGRTPH
jgi:Ca2+-binding RTX toxin-like protein